MAEVKSGAATMTTPLSSILVVNHLRIHHLFRSCMDVVHGSDPGHLIGCLELLRDTFGPCHLIDQMKEHFFRPAVHFLQMGVQLAAEEHGGVNGFPILQHVLASALAPDADMRGRRQNEVGNQVIALLMIGSSKLFDNDFMRISPLSEICTEYADSGFLATKALFLDKLQ